MLLFSTTATRPQVTQSWSVCNTHTHFPYVYGILTAVDNECGWHTLHGDEYGRNELRHTCNNATKHNPDARRPGTTPYEGIDAECDEDTWRYDGLAQQNGDARRTKTATNSDARRRRRTTKQCTRPYAQCRRR